MPATGPGGRDKPSQKNLKEFSCQLSFSAIHTLKVDSGMPAAFESNRFFISDFFRQRINPVSLVIFGIKVSQVHHQAERQNNRIVEEQRNKGQYADFVQ